MHGNQQVLKIAILEYYSVSKRATTAESNPKQDTDPIILHTKFGEDSSNTGHRTPEKAKNNMSTPMVGVDINTSESELIKTFLCS